MEKVKAFFIWLIKLIVIPLVAIVKIPISDNFINFMNKHVWLRFLISGVIMLLIMSYIYIYII